MLLGKWRYPLIIQKIPVCQLNPAAYNPRRDLRPGDKEYEKLKRFISEFGYVEPVIWNEKTGDYFNPK